MNIVLFSDKELQKRLGFDDARTKHIREVLRMSVGDQFYVGAINGPRGKATIVEDGKNQEGMLLEIEWESAISKSLPITLIIGLPRPQTGRKILEECTSMGIERLLFFSSEKGESTYADSKLWRTDEWKRHLIKGAEQAFSTLIPEVIHFENLKDCLGFIEENGTDYIGIALDNYEATGSLTDALTKAKHAKDNEEVDYVLAIGPERGWSKNERDLLRGNEFVLAHLGERVLRVEAACVAGISLIASRLGVM